MWLFDFFPTPIASTDSPAAAVDSETITLNSGTLQTFEILPPEHLLNASDNVTVQCHTPSVIIRTVATEDISSVTQAELTVDSHIQSADLSDPPSTLEADTFAHDIHQSKLSNEEQSAYIDDDSSKFSGRDSTELIDGVMVRTEEEISDTDLKREEDSHSNLTDTYVTEDLGSPAIEEQVDQSAIDDETVLIVPSPHGFIQTSDDIDNESVLPLTTLTDPILQHHGEGSHIIGSCLDSPDSEDSKDVEDLVRPIAAPIGLEQRTMASGSCDRPNLRTLQGKKDRGRNSNLKQCRMKLKELRQAYQKIREPNGHSGSERQTCHFYDELYAILGGSATTTPAMLFDSFNGDGGNTEAGFGDEEDDDDEVVDSSQQASGENGFPDSQELFLILDLKPVPSEPTQGSLPDPPGEEGTSGSTWSSDLWLHHYSYQTIQKPKVSGTLGS
ncbi:Cyclin-D-binding Myb-like transcription factor 1 [Chelonia mydas]|uniref:Cyclin-D-binding Myb-like transcription factor 1 n=1 Tax=Chelonia mydas TaxID=8469 RepID=M7BGG5_CHEMY|nr:Cyclin-D-binding Myb-like transcription factor 1 [Chelonia mydas]